MDRAVKRWAEQLPTSPDRDVLLKLQKCIGRSYVVYGDMLLLPPASIDGYVWRAAQDQYGNTVMTKLLEGVCQCLKVTHIAINRPIPLQADSTTGDNILRSPVHFEPVYGDFGPIEASNPPTSIDFDQAYWTTARQNGIAQTWAPRWTMFSRGNISEKARVLELSSVAQAVTEGKEAGTASSAVDLYAGIGYFSFSYVKAGIAKVLCWELNEWSCEGLRRGAYANGWKHRTWRESDNDLADIGHASEQLLIFNESNEHAVRRLQQIRNRLPPIRHVNCGLLPTSRPSWHTALEALDVELGGWIHVHENFALKEIEVRAEQVRHTFQDMLDDMRIDKLEVVLEGINRVKSYAPGVFHCVLDIFVPPRI